MQRMFRIVLIIIALFSSVSAICGAESPSSVANGVLLVASPTLNDPNFSETVVLVVEHGAKGTLGVILNRPTNMLLSEALPAIRGLKGSNHRLFAGEARRQFGDAPPAVLHLAVGIHPAQEPIGVTLQDGAYTLDLDHIHADGELLHAGAIVS